jgi:sterol desaturase/sphingolipid hydroxylase (fatty acid hydroxylase superfamily)
MLEMLSYAGGLFATFMVWTLLMYWMHRGSHLNHRRNPLWWVHTAHHRIPYLSRPPVSKLPTWPQFLWWLGSWRASMDVVLVMTLPLLLIALVVPQYGVPLLVFHYLYEVFFSEYLLDHNPRIRGAITRYFAWGDYHLHHHAHPRRNFGLLITFWDRVFGTADDPPVGAALRKVEQMLARQQRRSTDELAQVALDAALKS